MSARDDYIARLTRHYDAEDGDGEGKKKNSDYQTNRKTAKDKHHGNTRVAYGLCDKYNIQLPDDATPKDAWDALEKIGIFADDAYDYLEEHGTIRTMKPDKKKAEMDPDEEEIIKKIKEKLEVYNFENLDEIIDAVLKRAEREDVSADEVLRDMDVWFSKPLSDECMKLIRKEHGDKAAEDVKELLAYLNDNGESGETYKKIGRVNKELQGLSKSDFRAELNEWKYYNKMITKEQYDYENSHNELGYEEWGDDEWKDELKENEDIIAKAVDDLEDALDKSDDGYPSDDFYKELYRFYDDCGYDPGEKSKAKKFAGAAKCAEKIRKFCSEMLSKYKKKAKEE